MPVLPIPTDQIVITASRTPQAAEQTPASVTIIDQQRIDRLGEPLGQSLLRLAPSTSVSINGPAGTLAEVRIRGAEANHTLLFIDGIAANDPAAGDTPRFELLNADILSRMEIVRGPQSALWGSDAVGGVVAVNGLPVPASTHLADLEGGSFGFRRAGASVSQVTGDLNIAVAVGLQRATGIDSFNGLGDKDGYRNLSGRVRATWQAAPDVEFGLAGFNLAAHNDFDGADAFTFVRADTLDNSKSRMAAGRIWARYGDDRSPWSASISASALGSLNRNFLTSVEQNRTKGERESVTGQVERQFRTGSVAHTLIVAADAEREHFEAADTAFGGATDQSRRRTHQALTGEWRAVGGPLVADIALRHDFFSTFKDSTTLRGSLLADVGGGFSVAGSYGEGIAQPTFFDLYGGFPGLFIGNPKLKPETSRGEEVSIRYRRGALSASLTGYRQRLSDEIETVFASSSFTAINRPEKSRRQGVEAELGWAVSTGLRLSANYAYLKASEPGTIGTLQVRETRRPKHSGSIAVDGSSRRMTYGASIAYVGARTDKDFDLFPAPTVPLGAYWLAGARLAYRLAPRVEIFARGANLFNARYEDVVGYRTEGRAGYVGLRFTGA